MESEPLNANEKERLLALHSYEVLNTACVNAYDDLATLAARLTRCPIGLVALVEHERLWFKAHPGLETAEMPGLVAFCAETITNRDPLIMPDARLDERFADNPLVVGAAGLRFYAGVPLVNPENLPVGTLCVIDHVPHMMTEIEQEALVGLASAVMTTLELGRTMQQLQRFAVTDPLTGLANRPAFMVALDKAIARQRRTGEAFGLLCLDLDNFRRINVALGHEAGDDVLREAARVLVTEVRREDTASRLDADSFGVILATGQDEFATAAERIRVAIAGRMAQYLWGITASIGSVRFATPPDDAEAALALATLQVHEARRMGRNATAHADFAPAVARPLAN